MDYLGNLVRWNLDSPVQFGCTQVQGLKLISQNFTGVYGGLMTYTSNGSEGEYGAIILAGL